MKGAELEEVVKRAGVRPPPKRRFTFCDRHVAILSRRTLPGLFRLVAVSISRQLLEVLDPAKFGHDSDQVVREVERKAGGCPVCYLYKEAGNAKTQTVINTALDFAAGAF